MDIAKFLMDALILGAGSWFGDGGTGSNTLLPNLLMSLS